MGASMKLRDYFEEEDGNRVWTANYQSVRMGGMNKAQWMPMVHIVTIIASTTKQGDLKRRSKKPARTDGACINRTGGHPFSLRQRLVNVLSRASCQGG
jgi:hypothetical protein